MWSSREHWERWANDEFRQKMDERINRMLVTPSILKVFEETIGPPTPPGAHDGASEKLNPATFTIQYLVTWHPSDSVDLSFSSLRPPMVVHPSTIGLNKAAGVAKKPSTCKDIVMRIGPFEINEPVPEFDDLHVIAILRPWIDVGSVGTLALTRLERHLGSQVIGKLARPGTFFDFTRYRPTMRYVEGRREVTVPNTNINYARRQEGPDFLFFHMLEPHAFGEDYCEGILELLEHFGVKGYCRIGGMYDAVPHTRPLIVTGSAYDGQAEAEVGGIELRQSTYQGPTSIIHLINDGLVKLNINNTSLMVHLPQYVQLEEDYAGMARLLQVLCSVYNLPTSLAESRRARRQYRELSMAMENNREVKSLIARLETYYDSQEGAPPKDKPSPLSPEVEKFLREMGQRFSDT